MTIRYLLLAIILICLSACSQGQTSSDPYDNLQIGDPPPVPIGKNVDIYDVVAKKRGRLGSACRIIRDDDIAEFLGIDKGYISLSNATPRDADPGQTACFYKWDDPEKINSGIFIQLLKNPLPEEFPDYIVQFIEQKRTIGEQEYDGAPTIFQAIDWGDDGSYDTGTGKYYWRLGDQVAFALAFNTNHTDVKQYQLATRIATRLTQNYVGQ